MERHEQLANAFVAVARADHYMVGIIAEFSDVELDLAEQILSDRQNEETDDEGEYTILETALDYIADVRLKRR